MEVVWCFRYLYVPIFFFTHSLPLLPLLVMRVDLFDLRLQWHMPQQTSCFWKLPYRLNSVPSLRITSSKVSLMCKHTVCLLTNGWICIMKSQIPQIFFRCENLFEIQLFFKGQSCLMYFPIIYFLLNVFMFSRFFKYSGVLFSFFFFWQIYFY